MISSYICKFLFCTLFLFSNIHFVYLFVFLKFCPDSSGFYLKTYISRLLIKYLFCLFNIFSSQKESISIFFDILFIPVIPVCFFLDSTCLFFLDLVLICSDINVFVCSWLFVLSGNVNCWSLLPSNARLFFF